MTRTGFFRALRGGAVLCAFVLLSGCQMANMVSSWFESNGAKSNLRGVRISVMSLDQSLKPDPSIQNTPVVLPAPFRNPEWPNAGGYSSNAMYHLQANGPLREVWRASAGKGSDSASRLTAPPVVGGGFVFTLDSEAHVYVFRASDGREVWNRCRSLRWPMPAWFCMAQAMTLFCIQSRSASPPVWFSANRSASRLPR